ncbi:hypothetical protein PROFUN_02621 [Planoprotostelium fungivorum]|uniref:Uncharacterized protein n=1 Tax=Planoprotostelium fungivorum TaxID=1890364 RepID=A0A2P6NV91_9EUKA|nr:hypothetical protein PROFUN_02621 [Planoprotostelium fungivorum]
MDVSVGFSDSIYCCIQLLLLACNLLVIVHPSYKKRLVNSLQNICKLLCAQSMLYYNNTLQILHMLCTVLVTITALDNKYKLSHKVPGHQGWPGCFAEIFRFASRDIAKRCHDVTALNRFHFQRPRTDLRSISRRIFLDFVSSVHRFPVRLVHCPFAVENIPSLQGNYIRSNQTLGFWFEMLKIIQMPLIINNGVYTDDDAGYDLVIATYGLDRARPITLQDVAQIMPSIAFALPSARVAPPPGQQTGNWTAVQAPAPQTAPTGQSIHLDMLWAASSFSSLLSQLFLPVSTMYNKARIGFNTGITYLPLSHLLSNKFSSSTRSGPKAVEATGFYYPWCLRVGSFVLTDSHNHLKSSQIVLVHPPKTAQTARPLWGSTGLSGSSLHSGG